MEKHGLSRLQPNSRNPRRISAKRLKMLRKAMEEFGDLGGIIKAADDVLIGGHQRIQAFREEQDAQIHITHRYDKPTRTGTLAEGFVMLGGERFGYRETNWTGERALAATLAANKSAGDWDMNNLTSIVNELADSSFDLDLTMFSADELLSYRPSQTELNVEAMQYPAAEPRHMDDGGDDAPSAGQGSSKAKPEPQHHIKRVELLFRESDHDRFVEMTDALKDIYRRDNLSDTVLEAIKRASIRAAVSK